MSASNIAEQARAGITSAVSAMPELLAEVQRMIDETNDPAVRQALLELRREIESAMPELSVAAQRVGIIAHRIAAL